MCQAFDGERKFLMAMDDHPKYEAGEGEEWRGFYNQHRGGSGNVIVVTAIPPSLDLRRARLAVFSCIEAAEKFAETFSEKHKIIFAPYVVDEPDFGNAVKN